MNEAAKSPVDPRRSALMSRIRSRDTQPEWRVRRALHSAGLRYRLYARELPGAPDIVLPGRGVVVFVHGCFWHSHHGCRAGGVPKTRREFWIPKLKRTSARDELAKTQLESMGWRVVVIWECETKDPLRLAAMVETVAAMPRLDPRSLRSRARTKSSSYRSIRSP
jgi:DNA mismatch endonuclease (patch repair protein)